VQMSETIFARRTPAETSFAGVATENLDPRVDSRVYIEEGPYNFDPLTPLTGWVESGVAPDRIIGEVPAGPPAGRTFPLCPFPSLAVYQGGNLDDAANWVCKAHTNHRFSPGNGNKGNLHG